MLLLWIGLLVGVSVLGNAFAGEHSMTFSTPATFAGTTVWRTEDGYAGWVPGA